MSIQTGQTSQSARSNEQGQPSQRRDLARSSPRAGSLERRMESPFGLAPFEFLRANPFSLMRRMAEEMDRVFQEVGLEREGGNATAWTPAIDVSQQGGTFKVHAELAGIEPQDVKVEVENDALIIQGERKFEREEKNEGMQRTERQYGLFYRSIPLPEGANVEQAQAKFHNGILEIMIPVPEQQSSRRSIPVQGEGAPSKPSKSQAA
jgi:HSP20 family protein